MKKLFIIILSTFLLYGCNNMTATITIHSDLNLEYNETKYIYDLFDIENGTIITDNYQINTLHLGPQKLTIKYKNNYGLIKETPISISIVDTTTPLIMNQDIYTIEAGKTINLASKPLCADNYDRDIVCTIEGSYDTTTIGEYPLKFVAIDSSSNKTEKEFTLIVKNKIVANTQINTSYALKDLIKDHKAEQTMIGIDVSTWQGNINWEKVKKAGVEFAMIRIGYGHTANNELMLDTYFTTNLKEAKANNIKVGIYFYTHALTTSQAIEQAQWIIKTLNGEALDLPIAFDWETWSKFTSYDLNLVDINNIARAFMDEVANAGYQGMNYGSASYQNRIWDIPEYPTWLAHYIKQTTYAKDYYIWQLSSSGKVDGINGNVDLNVLYKQKEQ